MAIGSLAAAVALAVVAGIGGWLLVDSRTGCEGNPLRLFVAASPDVAPALSKIAVRYNDGSPKVGDSCVEIQVRGEESAAVMNALSGEGSVPGRVESDAWVPDSSMWAGLLHDAKTSRGRTAKLTETRIAASPVVIGMSRAVASRLGKQGQPSWRMLLPDQSQNVARQLQLRILDPSRNAAGMVPLMVVRGMAGSDTRGLTILTAVFRSIQQSVAESPEALMTSYRQARKGAEPVIITSEQSIFENNTQGSPRPIVAAYPKEGTASLDYPYIQTTTDPERVRASEAFRAFLGSDFARSTVQRHGFRAPDGAAGDNLNRKVGVDPGRVKTIKQSGPEQVEGVLQAWSRLSLGTRMLTVVDVSGSMGQTVPGTDVTRMQAITQIARQGLTLFPDDSEIGLWVFSTNLDGLRDHKERVAIGPLSDQVGSTTRRKKLNQVYDNLKPDGNTGLYDTILAAYREMKKGYQPDKANVVLLLTDGKNEGDDNGITLNRLLRTLRAEHDARRPVTVVSIAYGPDIEAGPLREVAKVTGGSAYVARTIDEVRQFFLREISRRLCQPQCPESG